MISKALVVASYRSKLRELTALGAEMTTVVPRSWKEAGEAIRFEKGEDGGYRVIQAPIAWNGHFHLHYYPSLGRVMRQVRPDLVHVDEEAYNLAAYLAIRSARTVAAGSLFFSWQNIRRTYPPPFRQMETYVYKHADYALAGSRAARDILIDKGYAGPVKVIPQFGVDTDLFTPGERPERPFTVGFLGRMVPEKGVPDLMSAFQVLQSPARLILAGDGPLTGYVDSVGAELKRHGRLERFPRVSSNEVPSLLRRIDVVVLPSRTTPSWREQYGRILVEAMAAGVVVVGSDSGEIPSVVGDAGIIFPERDVRGLQDALLRLSNDADLREELIRSGRRRAVEKFSQQSVARQTYAVYQEIMNAGRESWASQGMHSP